MFVLVYSKCPSLLKPMTLFDLNSSVTYNLSVSYAILVSVVYISVCVGPRVWVWYCHLRWTRQPSFPEWGDVHCDI